MYGILTNKRKGKIMKMGFKVIESRKADAEALHSIGVFMAAGTMVLLAFVVVVGVASVIAQAVHGVM